MMTKLQLAAGVRWTCKDAPSGKVYAFMKGHPTEVWNPDDLEYLLSLDIIEKYEESEDESEEEAEEEVVESSDGTEMPADMVDLFGSRTAEVLVEAGFDSLDDVPRDRDELTAINGIGSARASKILEALDE